MSYKHFSLEERYYIDIELGKGTSINAIAKALNRPQGTVSKEIARNKGKKDYRHKQENHKRAVVTLDERVSKLRLALPLTRKKAEAVKEAIVALLSPFKHGLKTITFDNGRVLQGHFLWEICRTYESSYCPAMQNLLCKALSFLGKRTK